MRQTNGDYMLSIRDLMNGQGKSLFDKNEIKLLGVIIDKYDSKFSELAIYIPSLELQDKKYPIQTPLNFNNPEKLHNNLNFNDLNPLIETDNNPSGPVGVLIEDPNAPLLNSYPGYIVDPYGNLTYLQEITELHSWHNDVWIIGFQEILVQEAEKIADIDLIDPYSDFLQNRVNGEMERVGFFQVHEGKLNHIQPCVKGKISMRLLITDALGRTCFDQSFGKLRRWRFMSEKWVEFDKNMGGWDSNIFGLITYEKWIEVNSGDLITNSITIPAANGNPGFTINYTKTEKSTDLGIGAVQFNDIKTTIYNSMSYSNFRRK